VNTVRNLLGTPFPWDLATDPHGIVCSSRVRLARNREGWPFHRMLSRSRQQELTEQLAAVLSLVLPAGTTLGMDALSELERAALAERQVVSRDLAVGGRPGAVHVDGAVSAMVNEEDHLRLQVLGSGLCLQELLERAVAVDQAMEAHLTWATHPRLGYLTAWHTNVGTGLRASVMLHLPALAETGELKAVLRACARLHLAVRGLHGEGSDSTGHRYQISNARSLGLSEGEYVQGITTAVERVVDAERLAREQLLTRGKDRLLDKIGRAWGVLAYARTLTGDEAQEHLSWLRLGVALDLTNGWTGTTLPAERRLAEVDRLVLQVQPG
jgi:protein arginine kinase